jgi:hypothetical protein
LIVEKGETDLDTLLRTMEPALRPGRYVYCTFAEADLPPSVQALCIYREAEGYSAILEEGEALRHEIAHQFQCALITLNVHSDLAAVGFMSVVLGVLAELDIPCNVVSAYYHDHLFVPVERAGEAMAALQRMSTLRHTAFPEPASELGTPLR